MRCTPPPQCDNTQPLASSHAYKAATALASSSRHPFRWSTDSCSLRDPNNGKTTSSEKPDPRNSSKKSFLTRGSKRKSRTHHIIPMEDTCGTHAPHNFPFYSNWIHTLKQTKEANIYKIIIALMGGILKNFSLIIGFGVWYHFVPVAPRSPSTRTHTNFIPPSELAGPASGVLAFIMVRMVFSFVYCRMEALVSSAWELNEFMTPVHRHLGKSHLTSWGFGSDNLFCN